MSVLLKITAAFDEPLLMGQVFYKLKCPAVNDVVSSSFKTLDV